MSPQALPSNSQQLGGPGGYSQGPLRSPFGDTGQAAGWGEGEVSLLVTEVRNGSRIAPAQGPALGWRK